MLGHMKCKIKLYQVRSGTYYIMILHVISGEDLLFHVRTSYVILVQDS
jgi:hypothetical protein